MRSRLYVAEAMHHRIGPPAHRFRYSLATAVLDLEELPVLAQQHWWFGYNRPGLCSLHSQDYLEPGQAELKEKLERQLLRVGILWKPGRVLLVTGLRCLGYTFNPVSFWFCYHPQGHLGALVAEVNNTFGEKHVYVLDQPLAVETPFLARYCTPKDFYVSPFQEVSGHYEFRVKDPQDGLDIRLRLLENERPIFNSWLRAAEGRSLSLRSFIQKAPWSLWLTLSRIHWEAAVLYFQKKVPLVYKPRPASAWTIRAEPPSWWHRQVVERVHRFLQRCSRGEMVWDLPDGRVLTFGGSGGVRAGMRILNWDFYLRLVWDGDVALGDGLLQGEWESEDLVAVVRFFVDNRDFLEDKKLAFTRWLGRAQGWLRQRWRSNTLAGSRRNIQAHYDLGNELYRRFLDPSMSYSCAYYDSEQCDLERAQQNKIRRLLAKARLHAECHVLEIGSGWGSLAIEAVRQSGCRVTGLTLSPQQLEWSQARVREAGLEDRIEFRLCDYRQMNGRFDRILSCEMLEAVGHENYPRYFSALERLLAPDGLAVLQVIVVPDFSYDEYRHSQDWIQKEIFPGALCPSLTALLDAMKRHSRLLLEDLENLGPHYARTLRDWRKRFQENWPELELLGYDERFRRAWTYYLSYCEAAFASRNLQDLQLVLTRPKNNELLRQDPAWLQQ